MGQQNNNNPFGIVALLISIGLMGMGAWWLVNRLELFGPSSEPVTVSEGQPAPATQAPNSIPSSAGLASLPSAPVPNTAPAPAGGTQAGGTQAGGAPPIFTLPQSIPQGTTIRVGGSTSMVQLSQGLKQAMEGRYPGIEVATTAAGSGAGLQAIAQGSLDVAGISRPLKPAESQAGLVSVPVARDAIALVVGKGNPFTGSLSPEQAAMIFKGEITNWAQLGGQNQAIRVINRPPVSGTHQAFKTVVLQGQEFGKTANITTMERDATTPMLRALGSDGIGYATSAQVAAQQTVRLIPVNGKTVYSPDYPLQRVLAYAYRQPPNPAAQAFLGFALADEGKRAIQGQ